MNTPFRLTVVWALAAALSLGGCQRSQDAMEQAKEKAQQAGDKVAQAAQQAADQVKQAAGGAGEAFDAHRSRLQHRLEHRLSRLDSELQTLQQNVKRLTGDAQARGEKAIVDLQARRADVARRLTELEGQTGDAWSDLAQGVRQAVSDLESAVKDAKSRFK
jgi:ElaB/YqjD/DUF883 family membrane-anchored ribosome-binding protein